MVTSRPPNDLAREQLLAEIDETLRVAPTVDAFSAASGSDENLAWLGRAAAAIERWDVAKLPRLISALGLVPSEYLDPCQKALSTLKMLLLQARASLQLELGQASTVIRSGGVFDYFDGLRKLVEAARVEVFFIDPYLDAEFVSRYLPHVADGVKVRLLGGRRVPALLSAVDAFVKQFGTNVAVRASEQLHDRYLIVDGSSCYLSGASFKDGAKNAPAVIAQMTDAREAILKAYELIWDTARIERQATLS